jgi:hypothetical protein
MKAWQPLGLGWPCLRQIGAHGQGRSGMLHGMLDHVSTCVNRSPAAAPVTGAQDVPLQLPVDQDTAP